MTYKELQAISAVLGILLESFEREYSVTIRAEYGKIYLEVEIDCDDETRLVSPVKY